MWRECGCPRCWGHNKKKRTCRTPQRDTPPPAALLCLRPARQDAAYGRARRGRVLSEPQQPDGCCVQALRDPWGQACWLREQPHPIAGDSAHRPLAAMRPHPCGQRPHTPTRAERPQQGEGLERNRGCTTPWGFGAQRVHRRACGEEEGAHVGTAKRQIGRNFGVRMIPRCVPSGAKTQVPPGPVQ